MIVMDCSAAVEMALNTENGKLLARMIDPYEKVLAPDWFRIEVRNIFWKYVHAGTMTREEALENVAFTEALITAFVNPHEYLTESFMESMNQDYSIYDMLYLCLTRRNAATLFTVDEKLVRLCRETKINCVEGVDLSSESVS